MIVNGECGVFNPILMECLAEISRYFEKEFGEASVTDHFQRDLFQTVEQQMMDINEVECIRENISFVRTRKE